MAAPENFLTTDELLAKAESVGHSITNRTLRYYSSLGLLPSATMLKSPDGRMRGHYPESCVSRITLISLMQKQGLSLQQIEQALRYILASVNETDEEAILADWQQRIEQHGSLPLLFELLPTIGEAARQHLTDMLLAANLQPVASELKDIRLTVTSQTGATLSRFFLPCQRGSRG